MSNNNSSQHFQVAVADPTPLGLMGLAVVTMVASAAKLGIVSNVAWVLPWALFCGAGAQVVAGVLDYLHFWWDSVLRLRIFLVRCRHELDD